MLEFFRMRNILLNAGIPSMLRKLISALDGKCYYLRWTPEDVLDRTICEFVSFESLKWLRQVFGDLTGGRQRSELRWVKDTL